MPGRRRDISTGAVDVDALYRLVSPFLARILRRIRASDPDREDLSQHIWLVVVREAAKQLSSDHAIQRWLRREPDAERHLRRWVGSIARHVILNSGTRAHRRREQFFPEGEVHTPATGPSPARQAAEAERREHLLRWLDRVPEPRRTVIIMYYFEGRTTAEIADELCIPEGSVSSRLRRGRAELKAIIEQTARDRLSLLFGTEDLDAAMAELTAVASGNGGASALPDEDGDHEWLGLLAWLLLLGIQPRVAAAAGSAAKAEAPAGRAPAGSSTPVLFNRRTAGILLVALSSMGLLGARCAPGQAELALHIPWDMPLAVAWHLRAHRGAELHARMTGVAVPQEPDPGHQKELSSDANAHEDPAAVEWFEDAADAPLRPWFVPVELEMPPDAWRTVPMRPTTLLAPVIALCAGLGCKPNASGGGDGLTADGAGGMNGLGGAGGAGSTSSSTGGAGGGGSGAGGGGGGGPTAAVVWRKAFGGPLTQNVKSIAVDPTQNVLLAGDFESTIDFVGGPLTSAGGTDIFLAKLDPQGQHLWSLRFGDAGYQYVDRIVVDAGGNTVLAGHFDGVMDLGGGPLVSAGGSDLFLAKLDPQGQHLWSRRFGDSANQSAAYLALSSTGEVVTAGHFEGTLSFGGSPLASAGGSDIFVAKLDASGNHVHSTRFGDQNMQIATGVAVDNTGNIMLTGKFVGQLVLGGSPLASAGGFDIFLAKLNPSGGHLWSRRFGDAKEQSGESVTTDAAGDVLVTGTFDGNLDLGAGSFASAGAYDIFVAKWSSTGSHLWSRRFGNAAGQFSNHILATPAGDAILTGSFMGSIDFGGGPLTSTGNSHDAFIARLDASGATVFSERFGDAQYQSGEATAFDSAGNVVLAGNFFGSVDLGSGPVTSAGEDDLFVVKLAP